MSRKTKLITAICLAAQSFTSLVLSFVYAGKKKDLAKSFLGLGLIGGLGSAYLFYNEYLERKADRLAFEGDEWCDDDCDLCNDDLFDEDTADDINFTISDDEETNEKSEEESNGSNE